MTEEAEESVSPDAPVVPGFENVVDEPAVVGYDDEIAQEVLAGRWGRGHARDAKLEAAGHDPKAVKQAVARILGRK